MYAGLDTKLQKEWEYIFLIFAILAKIKPFT
jgi:hypothetical protein